MMLLINQAGKKIARLRKDQNMTQMELAEKMNVSFQAVSSWERGNTLPDIANLPRLAQLLNTTTDELLGVSEELAENAANDNLKAFVTENPVSKEEAVTIAPLLTPKENDVLFSCADSLNEEDKTALLPFLSNEFVDELFEKEAKNKNLTMLKKIAPYASQQAVNQYVLHQAQEGSTAEELLIFASDDALLTAAEKLTDEKDFSSAKPFFPFLSESSMMSLAQKEYEKNGIRNLKYLLPFLRENDLSSLALTVFEKDGFSFLRDFLPYLPEKFTEYLFERK